MSTRQTWQMLVIATALGVTGCHHKQPIAPLPVPPPAQVPLAPAPEPSNPPQVAQEPVAPTPVPTKPVPKPKKTRKKPDATAVPAVQTTPAPIAPPANQVAAVTPPPASEVIGSLSAGGETAPAEKQKAADLIVSVEKRVTELPPSTRDAQRGGLAKVHDFLLKAREALKTGDADGASTLATKARLLLDDLLK